MIFAFVILKLKCIRFEYQIPFGHNECTVHFCNNQQRRKKKQQQQYIIIAIQPIIADSKLTLFKNRDINVRASSSSYDYYIFFYLNVYSSPTIVHTSAPIPANPYAGEQVSMWSDEI